MSSTSNLIELLSVIVPLFNEEGNVKRFESELVAPLEALGLKFEVIFVDDGSKDDTHNALDRLFRNDSRIKILTHEKNKGMGAAIRSGIKAAQGDALVTLDGDLSFHPEEIESLVAHYNENVDVVLGSPAAGNFSGVSFFRKMLSLSANLVYRCLLGQKITSTTSLFRLYRMVPLRKIQLNATDFDINAEILLSLLKNGASIREIPVTLGARRWGQSKIKFNREIWNHLKFFGRVVSWRLWG